MTQRRIWLVLGVLLLLAGSWLAYSIPKRPSGGDLEALEPAVTPLVEPAATPLVEPAASPALPTTPAAPRAAPAGSASAPAPRVPLEKLLEVPAAPSAKPKVTVGPLSRSQAGAASTGGPSDRVQVEAAAIRDRPTVRPDRAAERLDVGVSVGVDETTRLRGGVRVESGTEEKREPTRTPVVGIEKRF